jgi:hypothetical protein
VIACVRERVSSTLLVESKKANSAEDKHRDIQATRPPLAQTVRKDICSQIRIFDLKSNVTIATSSFVHSNVAVFH